MGDKQLNREEGIIEFKLLFFDCISFVVEYYGFFFLLDQHIKATTESFTAA
jgi:hypothetical protein